MHHDTSRKPVDGPLRQEAPASPDLRTVDVRGTAIAVQVQIGAQSAVQLVLGLTGGTHSPVFLPGLAAATVLFFSTVTTFLVWFHRCRRNAEILAPGTHAYTPGWAIGSWFVPLGMWWIPRRIALDIWRSTGAAAGAWIVNAWWAAWLTQTVLTTLLQRLGPQAGGYAPVTLIVGTATAALAILMVRRLTARQTDALHNTLPEAPAVSDTSATASPA